MQEVHSYRRRRFFRHMHLCKLHPPTKLCRQQSLHHQVVHTMHVKANVAPSAHGSRPRSEGSEVTRAMQSRHADMWVRFIIILPMLLFCFLAYFSFFYLLRWHQCSNSVLAQVQSLVGDRSTILKRTAGEDESKQLSTSCKRRPAAAQHTVSAICKRPAVAADVLKFPGVPNPGIKMPPLKMQGYSIYNTGNGKWRVLKHGQKVDKGFSYPGRVS